MGVIDIRHCTELFVFLQNRVSYVEVVGCRQEERMTLSSPILCRVLAAKESIDLINERK